MKRVLAVALGTLLLFCLASLAQTPGSTPPLTESTEAVRIQQRFQQVGKLYEAGRYADALAVLEQTQGMAELKRLPQQWRAEVLYGLGALHARLGHKQQAITYMKQAAAAGVTRYSKYTDEDLGPLHSDRHFRRLMADVRANNGIGRLAWNRTEKREPFAQVFDDPETPQLVQMRREFHTDEAIAGTKDDLQRLRGLALWTSRQWEHSNTQMASRTDPLTILREAKQGGKFICMNYAVVLAGAAQAYGMPARVLGLLPRDTEERPDAHSVVEVWLKQYGKWVIADAQYGIVPTVHGRPVNAIELQDAIVRGKPLECGAAANCAEWSDWIVQYLYHFKIAQHQRRFSTPERNPQLVLLPMGAPYPHKYDGKESGVFIDAVYTSNPDVFYAPPAQGREFIMQ